MVRLTGAACLVCEKGFQERYPFALRSDTKNDVVWILTAVQWYTSIVDGAIIHVFYALSECLSVLLHQGHNNAMFS